jgi:hypothetical protein
VPKKQIYLSEEQIQAEFEDGSRTLASDAEEFLRNQRNKDT